MFEKKDDKEKAAEAGLPESAVEAKAPAGKDKGKVVKQAPVNELVFRVGDELKLSDLPFEIKEVKGRELILQRKDIK